MAARTWIWVVPVLAICGAGCSKPDVPASTAKQPARPANLPLAPAVATAALPAQPPRFPRSRRKARRNSFHRFPRTSTCSLRPKRLRRLSSRSQKRPPIRACPCTHSPPVTPEKRLRPPLRLVGFVNVASPKALLSLDGKLSAVQEGETIQEVEVIAVEPPCVTLKFDDEEYSINLLERSVEGVRTSIRTTPALPMLPAPRGAVVDRSAAPTAPAPTVVAPPSTAPAPPAPVPSVAVAAEKPPSAPPLPSLETAEPPKPPALPAAAAVNSLRELPKLP